MLRCAHMVLDSDDAEDAALVAAMARGDREALATLYRRHAGVLFGTALRIVGDRREAEDLLHDVWLETWRSAGDYDPKRGRVRTWLAIRMRSRAIDRKQSARVARNAGDAGLAALIDERERSSPDHARVRAVLAELTSDQRQIVELAYFDGLSCSQIAEQIAIPIGTVKSRLAAGLRALRARIGGER